MKTSIEMLRRRPNVIRYFYLAVSDTSVHTGTSHGGLDRINKSCDIKHLFLSDLSTGETFLVNEPVADFLERWKHHYNDASWDYKKEMEGGGV